MKYRIGYTVDGQIIVQDMNNGDVRLLKDNNDKEGVFYPYSQWKDMEPNMADWSTISYKFHPSNPGKLTESIQEPGDMQYNWEARIKGASHQEILIFSGVVLVVIVLAVWLIRRKPKTAVIAVTA